MGIDTTAGYDRCVNIPALADRKTFTGIARGTSPGSLATDQTIQLTNPVNYNAEALCTADPRGLKPDRIAFEESCMHLDGYIGPESTKSAIQA